MEREVIAVAAAILAMAWCVDDAKAACDFNSIDPACGYISTNPSNPNSMANPNNPANPNNLSNPNNPLNIMNTTNPYSPYNMMHPESPYSAQNPANINNINNPNNPANVAKRMQKEDGAIYLDAPFLKYGTLSLFEGNHQTVVYSSKQGAKECRLGIDCPKSVYTYQIQLATGHTSDEVRDPEVAPVSAPTARHKRHSHPAR